jgi:hypothetical protein
MKKNIFVLMGLFLVSGIVVYWVLKNGTEKQNTTLFGWDRKFKVENTDEIYKIFIAKRTGETVDLTKKGNTWMYNNQYEALPNAMENLMRAFREMEIKYKPADAAVPTMISDLAAQGIKVELYDKKNKRLKAFYVGGAPPDERGTYMIMEDSNQPYVVHLPTWEGNLRFRFNLTGDQWRDKTVFRETVEDIKTLTVEYPKQQNESFKLTRLGNKFEVAPFYDFTPKITASAAQGLIEAYLVKFKKVGAEAFENDNPRRDSILQTLPFCIISMEKTNGEKKVVQFFPIETTSTFFDPKTNRESEMPYVERYFADVSDKGFMLVQHIVFSKLFWGYSFFFEEKLLQ